MDLSKKTYSLPNGTKPETNPDKTEAALEAATMSTKRQGPPKHQNRVAWKPNAGITINPTEVGGKRRPLSEITGVCQRCREQIDWKRRYGKYKALSEPAKCQGCSKRAVRQAYHNLCPGCAKEQNVCAKCRCRVGNIVGRDIAEVEAEQKLLEDAIKNARERDRRSLLRAMNKAKSQISEKQQGTEGSKVGDLFPHSSLDEYATKVRAPIHGVSDHVKHDDNEVDQEEEEDDESNDNSDNGDEIDSEIDGGEEDGAGNEDCDNSKNEELETENKNDHKM